MTKVVIFGTGQGASAATRYFRFDSHYEIVGYTVHSKYISSPEYNGLPVVPYENLEDTFPPTEYLLFAPLGFEEMNKVRQRIFDDGKQRGYTFATYVHSSVKTIEPLVIGENCFILENQSINLDVRIGNNVVMWSGNQIGDRATIEDHVWISSHVCICGNVHVKSNSVLSANSTLSTFVVVERENFIGANALIAKNTQPGDVYLVPQTPKAVFSSDRFIKMIKL